MSLRQDPVSTPPTKQTGKQEQQEQQPPTPLSSENANESNEKCKGEKETKAGDSLADFKTHYRVRSLVWTCMRWVHRPVERNQGSQSKPNFCGKLLFDNEKE